MIDNEEYPLYPMLTEQGKEEAQRLMDSFKPMVTKVISDAVESIMCDLYTDVSYHIESDHWTNYGNAILDGFKGYRNGTGIHEPQFKELRKAIYENNKDEIIKDLNQDLVKENERLNKHIAWLNRPGYQ